MKSELITIFEDYQKCIPLYQDHIKNLYCLREIVKNNNFSLQVDGMLKISHYVGFFQKGNTRVQILPKVYAKSSPVYPIEEEIKVSIEFIHRLLYWSGYLNVKMLPPQSQSSSETDLLEIFINIFVGEFIKLFQKKIYQTYEQQEENQQFIKGKIVFSETIRINPLLKNWHYVQFDEFTINNPLNQIFKAIIHLLLYKSNDRNNKKQLVMALAYLQEVDLLKLNNYMFDRIKFDRLNTEFQPLFNLAKLFYHNIQPGITGGQEDTFSFLVPVHLLFEKFIAKVLSDLSNTEKKFIYHSCKYFGYEGSIQRFMLEPDFIFLKHNTYLCILDTKYKYPFDQNGNPAIDEKDLYQLSTYAHCYNCRNLVLIYPKFIGAPHQDVCLTEYILKSVIGTISLKVVQIDIMEDNLSNISTSISAFI